MEPDTSADEVVPLIAAFLGPDWPTGQLAVSHDSARLYAEFRRIADEQAALRRVATLVARGVQPDLVFATVAEEVGALFGADAAAIARFEPNGEVTMMGGYGFGELTTTNGGVTSGYGSPHQP